MADQLNVLQMPHEFLPAVDGRKLTEANMREMCDMDVVRQWSQLLTPGMIGCSLSHHRAYQKMVTENIDFALILEDDTRLSREVPRIVDELESNLRTGLLDQNEPILLYYQSKEKVAFSNANSVRLKGGTGAFYPIDIWRPITTAAYVISLPIAKRLAALVYPVRYSPDSWAVFHRENAIGGLRCVLPLPVESGFFKSDIGYEQHKRLNQLVKGLEARNVFPVKQLLHWRRRRLARKQNRYVIMDSALNWQRKPLT